MNELYEAMYSSGIDQLIKDVAHWKTDSYIELPSEWAETERYLPAGTTEYPGKIDHSVAPYAVEILDNFHPDSGVVVTSVMKGTQALITTTVESAIGHAIKHKLHNTLYIISSKNIAKIRSSAAIDVMIDNSGLAKYVKPISERMKRKTSDTTFYKEFHGGRRLMMTSWNSIGDAKSLTWSLIIMDEIDEAPYELKGQGDPEKIFAGRGKTVRNLKIAKISTPTTTNGRIYRNFKEGDQRYFHVPCPICGEKQVLELMGAGKDYGLTAHSEMKDGVVQILPETVVYICKHCKGAFHEHQKGWAMQNGIWIPSARPVNPGYRSYHVSNLMSPVMFFTWTRCMQEFAETDFGQNVTRYKNFCIDVLGWPWESRSDKKDWDEIQGDADSYPLGIIPKGGYVVTFGVDVQKRWLEFQAVAWGVNMESWVIDHQKFHGETHDKNSGAWALLRKYIADKRYHFAENMQIKASYSQGAIDTGYNPKAAYDNEIGNNNPNVITEHTVYNFVAETPRAIACRGNDKLTGMIIRQEKVYKVGPLKARYDVAVSELKDEIFSKLDLPAEAPGKIHFTKDLSRDYFRGFSSEVYAETAPGKFNWKVIYERNEPLDTYILARAAAEKLNLPQWTEAVWTHYKKQLHI